jgi:hypothetical protein
MLWAAAAQAQYTVSGRVIDSETKAPLAFVNIVTEEQSRGTTTDIDGKFTLSSSSSFSALNVSYLGYEQLKYPVTGNTSNITIKLKRKGIQLEEVEILPGENPAHRIIKRVIENRDLNDPERSGSFTYTSYNKMYVTADISSADTANSLDTSRKKGLGDLLKKQHLFLSESVTEKKFLDGISNELVLATRTSGLKTSPFAFLATQIQSFSFYKEMIMLLDKNYLSPVSNGSYNKYLFILEDTLYQGNDSVYVISYRPKKGKTFDALKGTLYINTNGYALQNVIAEPVDNSGLLAGRVQQKYELIDNKHWFPVQLNTDWYYNLFTVGDSTLTMSSRGRSTAFDPNNKLKIVSRSYIKDIVIDPPLRKRDFSNIELEIAPDASSKTEEFWNKHRGDSLSLVETRTYEVVDSIGKEVKLDLKMRTYEALAFGKYPLGIFDLDLDRIYTHNEYEGERFGAGLHTSDQLARWFSVGGYAAYGLRDKGFKYGGDISFTLYKRSELKIGASYANDVVEAGGVRFFNEKRLLGTESFRNYLLKVMDQVEKKEASISFSAMRHWMVNLNFNTQTRTANNDYMFGIPAETTILTNTFGFTEAGIGFRFAYREKFLKTPRYKTSLGSDYPVLYAQVTKGIKGILDGQFEYMRYDVKMESSFFLREYGKTTVQLNAGLIDGDLPYTMLYNGKGSYEKYAVAYGNSSFGTMRMNEFLSDRYASLFFSHNLGKLLVRTEKFQPELVLITNIGFGSLTHMDHHFNIPVRTMEKGYYESGLLLNGLIRSELFGLGAGALYRYGSYALPEREDNIAVKFTFSVNF